MVNGQAHHAPQERESDTTRAQSGNRPRLSPSMKLVRRRRSPAGPFTRDGISSLEVISHGRARGAGGGKSTARPRVGAGTRPHDKAFFPVVTEVK